MSRRREESFGRKTSGYAGWVPVHFVEGTTVTEGFKNVLNSQEYSPPEGFNGEPPYPTGEIVSRHAGDAYRDGWERIWGAAPQNPS